MTNAQEESVGDNIESSGAPIQKNIDERITSVPYSTESTDKPQLECPVCHKLFSRKWVLNRHERYKHGNEKWPTWPKECDICGKTVDANNIKRHRNSHRAKTLLTCQYCSKSFIREASLGSHVRHCKNKPRSEPTE